MKLQLLLMVLCFGIGNVSLSAYQNIPKDVSVPLYTSTTDQGGLHVRLLWPSDTKCGGYSIYRKARGDNGFTTLEELAASDSTYTDTGIEEGIAYEYAIEKTLIKDSLYAYGFAAAGWKVGIGNAYGHMLLLVDQQVHTALKSEIDRLAQDLWNEGWFVQIKDAPRAPKFDTAAIRATKKLVRDWYETTNYEPAYMFIIGRVPVPYSGMVYGGQILTGPDGHGEHAGAWAADSYYACMADDEAWTDTATIKAGVYPDNKNLPGDGRYDNLMVPGSFDIRVGRLDMYNMGLFYTDSTGTGVNRHVDSLASEFHLLKNYLDRDHAFRSGSITMKNRGLIDDNFGGYGEQFARCAWMAYPALMGPGTSVEADYLSTLDTASYLWSYGCGGGGSDFQSAGGVGTSTQFASKKLNTIFSMLFGSYFGDWDKANNLLRAPLACKTPALTNCWAGRPYWYFHPMAMGESIGNCFSLTANNRGDYPYGVYPTGVHIALMGDPSLRMPHGNVPPALNLSAQQVSAPTKGVRLSWNAPSSGEIVGYYLYKQNAGAGIEPLNGGAMIEGLSYVDEQLTDGNVRYIVRAVGVLSSASGSYQSLSSPIEHTLLVSSVESLTEELNQLECRPNPSSQQCTIDLQLNQAVALELDVYSSDGRHVRRLATNGLCFGQQHVVWNLCDDAGHRVAEGIYILQAHLGSQLLVRKISVVH